jgi:tetratricopeptide (TPR) repeat protein
MITACAPVTMDKAGDFEPSLKESIKTSSEHEEKKALETFEEILELVNSAGDRQNVLPQIEERYKKIINDYPETPLAQESYWRLIKLYVEDYFPPDHGKAEQVYDAFLKRYPDSGMRSMIDETLGRSYQKHAKWNMLLGLCKPTYEGYENNGKFPRPLLLFFYSEAQYNLGNIPDAIKGYNTVIKLFPRSGFSSRAKAKLEEIRK